LGERTLLPARLGVSPPSAVDGVFGQGFFELLAELPPGVWTGPVASAYGVHLVRILDSLPARTPPLEEVRDAVLTDWKAAKAQEIREQDYAQRRARFVVKIRRGDVRTAENR
jgi:parvulin-like peptidyl-prolyl isomerase